MSMDAINAINTSTTVLGAPNTSLVNEKDRLRALAQLVSDNRIARAQDDAATIVTVSEAALAERRDEEDQASIAATHAENIFASADAARNDVANDLARLDELDAQAASDRISDADRENLRIEADFVKAELQHVADAAEFRRVSVANDDYALQQIQSEPPHGVTADVNAIANSAADGQASTGSGDPTLDSTHISLVV
jgi:flagellin-like hook-associated protein FlgL